MRGIFSLFAILLISCALTCGCSQTPAKVENEVPGVLANVSNDVGNATDHFEDNLSRLVAGTTEIPVKLTLAPIHSNYVAPVVVTITPAVTTVPDSITGNWILVGDNKPADCNVFVNADNTGEMQCNKFGVPVADDKFTWMPLESGYTNMDEYAINITGGQNYTAEYSERNGWITSDVLPAGTELERRS